MGCWPLGRRGRAQGFAQRIHANGPLQQGLAVLRCLGVFAGLHTQATLHARELAALVVARGQPHGAGAVACVAIRLVAASAVRRVGGL